MAIRTILADDHKMFRDGLRALIEKEQDIKVIGEAENGRTTVQLARELSPDVVVMDIGMPDLNGVEATRQIVTQCPSVRVIALSMHSDKRFVTEMLHAGASGYLLKDCAFQELAQAIRTVARNQAYLSPRIAGVVVTDYAGRLPATKVAALTPREREVLQLLAEGKNTKEIASALNVSVKTVETHRAQIMERLDLHSVAELTKFAIREGLTSLEG
jgi:DNA-binding NarL/FixJ family response regulator